MSNSSLTVEAAKQKYPECFGANPVSFNDNHLGGTHPEGDVTTYHLPNVFNYLFKALNLKSIVDIGCGFGYAMKFIKENYPDVEVAGVEGSAKVISLHLFPNLVKQHDYTTGPFKLDKQYDLGWSTEFVEHVEAQFVPNFLETFKCCKYVGFTFANPGQGGHHHVNENTQEYWVNTMQSANFEYLYDETQLLRNLARKDMEDIRAKDPHTFHVFHFLERGLFFKNQS